MPHVIDLSALPLKRRIAEAQYLCVTGQNQLVDEIHLAPFQPVHACESVRTPDGFGAYCKHCGTTLA